MTDSSYPQDYSDLPLAELRAVNDPTKYGWGSVLRNTAAYQNGRINIPFSPNPEKRYDCGAGAERLHQELNTRGIEAKVVYGVDQAQIFYNHVWVELADGRQLDPTPLYPFTNTQHVREGENDATEQLNYILMPSASQTPCSLRMVSPIEAYISELGFEIQKDEDLTVLGINFQVRKIVNQQETRCASVQNILTFYDSMPLETILNVLTSLPAEDFLQEIERSRLSQRCIETGNLIRTPYGIVPQWDSKPQTAGFEPSLEAEAGLFSAFAQNVVCAYLVSEQMKREQARSMSYFINSLGKDTSLFFNPQKKI